jgi:hypothetical protein
VATSLKAIPVSIVGEWKPVAFVGHTLWEGSASADEPITALALGRDDTGIHWARAGRPKASSLRLQLKVVPDGQTSSRYGVRIYLSVQPEGRTYSTGAAFLQTRVSLTSTAPFVFSLDHATTGVETWFARAWSEADIRFGALFVCEADTRSARNHLWHLRPGLAAGREELTGALNYGRQGKLPSGAAP